MDVILLTSRLFLAAIYLGLLIRSLREDWEKGDGQFNSHMNKKKQDNKT